MKALLVLCAIFVRAGGQLAISSDAWEDCYGQPSTKPAGPDAQQPVVQDMPVFGAGWLSNWTSGWDQFAESLLGCDWVPWGIGMPARQWYHYVPVAEVCAPYAAGARCTYNCFESEDACSGRCIERTRPPPNCNAEEFGATVGYELRYRYSVRENQCKLLRVSADCQGDVENCYLEKGQCYTTCAGSRASGVLADPGLPCQSDRDAMRIDVLSAPARVVNTVSHGCGAFHVLMVNGTEEQCWAECIDQPLCLMAAHHLAGAHKLCFMYTRNEFYDKMEVVTMSDGRLMPQIACSYCYVGGGEDVDEDHSDFTIMEKTCVEHRGQSERRRTWPKRWPRS